MVEKEVKEFIVDTEVMKARRDAECYLQVRAREYKPIIPLPHLYPAVRTLTRQSSIPYWRPPSLIFHITQN